MFALERQKRILELLKSDGAVWVSKLSTELDVTEETIRRDLEKLEKQNALRRTHGGALPMDDSMELSFEKRRYVNMEVKQQLARKAVECIVPGDTVFLDASTTTFFMSKEMRNIKNVTIVTNSIRIVNELSDQTAVRVIAVGGLVSNNQSFTGSMAEKNIRDNYFANKMFFSSRGVTQEAGILESNQAECSIKQAMIQNSKQRYYLCDQSKIGRVGFIKLAPLEQIQYFITDAALDETWKAQFAEYKIQTIQL